MAELTIQGPQGTKTVSAREGTLLSDVLRLCGCAPELPCGGRGRCGKCRVWASGRLSPPTGGEKALLTGEELAEGVRLACCTKLLGDAQVRLGADRSVSQICTEGIETALGGDPFFRSLGAAVDVGTTTLALRLCGEQGLLAAASAPNPQRAWGADVISRIGRAMEGESSAIACAVRKAIAGLLNELCEKAGRRTAELDALVITGNTAMLHLLTGKDPSPLAAAPFEARELFGINVPASELELPCAPGALAYLPRCMSAFVGADITTALLAAGICSGKDTALLTDIGTNGEIALWHGGELLCCSTAAGPAFEGANLSCGMQGTAGAVDHAAVAENRLVLHTIGDAPAAGVCGSGAADIIACLLQTDALDETGLLGGGGEYWPLTERVSFTQKDVRQVQLAKSAIRSGMETLLHTADIDKRKVKRLDIAGGFGSYLSLDSAAAIGLIPPELKNRCRVLGNAALSGAAMLLYDRALKDESSALASAARTVDLTGDSFFMEQYIENMLFKK